MCSYVPLLKVPIKFNQLTTEITQYSLTGNTEITRHMLIKMISPIYNLENRK